MYQYECYDDDIVIELVSFNGGNYEISSLTIHDTLTMDELNTILAKSLETAYVMKENKEQIDIKGYSVWILKTDLQKMILK